jgi:hypothetical protein
VTEVLEDSMRYTATIGWMIFDQMVTLNEQIPLYRVGGFKQLCNDSVDHKERIERMERVHEEMEEEIHYTNNMAYQGRMELEEWVERLEEVNTELRSGLHRSITELQWLLQRVSKLSQRVAGFIYDQGNPIVVKDSLEPGPSRLPQLPADHPHRLVPIEDLSGSLDGESLES